MVFLAIIATVVGFKEYNNMWVGLLSAFVVVIPSVYSLMPLIMEQRKLKRLRKNKLTESIFTDREEDLEDIIRILNIKEHCVQIAGMRSNVERVGWLKDCVIILIIKKIQSLKILSLNVLM